MMNRTALAIPLMIAAVLPVAPACAQSVKEVERRYDVMTPTGVSLANGAFSYQVPLLYAGQGSFPRQLSFDLSYNSGSDRYPGSAWSENIDARKTMTLVDDPYADHPDPDGKPPVEYQTWQYNIVYGHHSEGFQKYGNPVVYLNPFVPMIRNGSSLRVETAANGWKSFVLETGNGDIFKLRSEDDTTAPGKGDYYLARDGVRMRYNYGTRFSVSNNLGWALLYERATSGTASSTSVCAINLTQYYLPGLSACPAGVPKISYVVATSGNGTGRITSITEVDGKVQQFSYTTRTVGSNTRRALTCVKKAGSSQCDVANTFDNCEIADVNEPLRNGSEDRVLTQTFLNGTSIGFTWPTSPYGCNAKSPVVVRDAANATSTYTTDVDEGTVDSVADPLGRNSTFTYVGGARLQSATNPEGDKLVNTYDSRGNITEIRQQAKPGSGLADIVTSSVFPSTCSATVPCNKPTSTTDARGGVTDFTYDPVHWGVLTESGPAVGGVRPVKRFEYEQRYAWLKNAGGTFSQADEPVWMLVREKTCRTSSTVGNACAVGASDEVVTEYDYGPNSGPNNLLLRGTTVSANGTTLRTCFAYDAMGRKVSETKPSANLAVCP